MATPTMVATTRRRVRRNTAQSINQRVDSQIERNIRYFSVHRGDIARRLTELDEEWDIERMIEANAAAIAFTGAMLSVTNDRRFLALPLAVTAFLFQHALQGWCPPVPILRRLGFRTADEINRERYALKALRGDFDALADKKTPTTTANAAIKAVNA